ncbi:hypothetical protein E8E15_000337 [Penicillium rubens]|nr:hypothetical protein E8E15_000337 [Penicillium rubens]KAJ5035230.1 hypothetical protein NUH16_005060 [Penicillium rubens]
MTMKALAEGDSTSLAPSNQQTGGKTLPPASPADLPPTPVLENNEERKLQRTIHPPYIPLYGSNNTSNLCLPADRSSTTALSDSATEAGNDTSSHRYMRMKIDSSSQVFNGDLTKYQQRALSKQCNISGGSVNNGSLLINGDTDWESLSLLLRGSGSD